VLQTLPTPPAVCGMKFEILGTYLHEEYQIRREQRKSCIENTMMMSSIVLKDVQRAKIASHAKVNFKSKTVVQLRVELQL
jgi:hypothetical protein